MKLHKRYTIALAAPGSAWRMRVAIAVDHGGFKLLARIGAARHAIAANVSRFVARLIGLSPAAVNSSAAEYGHDVHAGMLPQKYPRCGFGTDLSSTKSQPRPASQSEARVTGE